MRYNVFSNIVDQGRINMFSLLKRLTSTPQALFITIAVVLLAAVSAVAIGNVQSQSVNAHGKCQEILIAYCGVTGSTTGAKIDAFQAMYDSNRSGHATSSIGKDYRDIQQIYNHFGATDAMVAKMNTTNTKLGTIYRDGRIVVDGKVVGKDAVTAGRFKTANSTNFPGTNIYIREPINSFASSSLPALVYFENGVMKFGIILECANPIKATATTTPPKTVEPKQELVCVDLSKTALSGTNRYRFTVKATAKNGATISGYSMNFNDGTETVTVTTMQSTATVDHTFEKDGNYKIYASVQGKVDGKEVSESGEVCSENVGVKTVQVQEYCPIPGKETLPKDSDECAEEPEVVTVTTPPTPVTPELPKTGAASAFALVGLTSAFGTVAHTLMSRYRSRR